MDTATRPNMQSTTVQSTTVQSTTEPSTARQWTAKGQNTFRPDIEGLRAVAVVLVICSHLFGKPVGGFVGVDIFFVISGFLITGLLLREKATTGRISYADFYRRRVRRIMPAAVLVIIVTVGAAYLLYREARFHAVVQDAIWSLLFGQNIHLSNLGTDYMHAGDAVSPLQHYWSLSVEEQFYLAWPLILLVLFAVMSRFKASKGATNHVVRAVVVVITIASFGWALRQTANDPVGAYFSTFSRAWELSLGAILATLSGGWLQGRRWLRVLFGWTGIAGIVISAIVINNASAFPAPWGALPVISAGLVILAGIGARNHSIWPLTNPFSAYVGRISYSLYLWHFPVIILGAAFVTLTGATWDCEALVVMFVLAIVSFHFIEDPIRRSNWLQPRSHHKNAARQKARGGLSLRVLGPITVTSIAVVTVVFVVYSMQYSAPAASESGVAGVAANQGASAAVTGTADVPALPMGPHEKQLAAEIDTALTAKSWPNLNPSLDTVIANDPIPAGIGSCGDLVQPAPPRCFWGSNSAPHKVILVGDSEAQAWLPALRDTFGTGSWQIHAMSMYGCPFVNFVTVSRTDKENACEVRKGEAVKEIAATKPDVVIIADTALLPTLKSSNQVASVDQWAAGLSQMVSKIKGSTPRIVLLSAPPPDKNIEDCATKASVPLDCQSLITESWQSISDSERSIMTAVHGGVYVNTSRLFCSADGRCPAFVANIPTKHDQIHPTSEYIYHLEGALNELLTANGVKV